MQRRSRVCQSSDRGMALVAVIALVVLFFGLGFAAFRSVSDNERLSNAKMANELLKNLTPEAVHVLMTTLKTGFQGPLTNGQFLGHGVTYLPPNNNANDALVKPFEVAFSLPNIGEALFNMGLKCKGPCRGMGDDGTPLTGVSHLNIGLLLSDPSYGARRFSALFLMKNQPVIGGFATITPPSDPTVMVGGDSGEENYTPESMYLSGLEQHCGLGEEQFNAYVKRQLAVPTCSGAVPPDVRVLSSEVAAATLHVASEIVSRKAETPLIFDVKAVVPASGAARTQFHIADFNRDGRPDILSVLGSGSPSHMFYNRAGSVIERKPILKPWGQQDSAAVADFDGDGKLDAASVSDVQNSVIVMGENGDESYTRTAVIYPNNHWLSPSQIMTQDFNRDGKPDLFFRVHDANGNRQLVCLLNNRDPQRTEFSFAPAVVHDTDRGPTICKDFQLTPGSDQTRLGYACSSSAGWTEDWSVVYEVKSDCSIEKIYQSETGTLVPGGSSPYGASGGDYNNDGIGDYVVSEGGGDSVVLYTGAFDGQGRLTYSHRILCLQCTNGRVVESVDIDQDGDLDMIIPGKGAHFSVPSTLGHIRILINQGDATFKIQNVHVEGDSREFNRIRTGDLNGDGLVDIVVMSTAEPPSIFILHQRRPEVEADPDLFSGVQATLVGKVIDTSSTATFAAPAVSRLEGEVAGGGDDVLPGRQIDLRFVTPAGSESINYARVCGPQRTVSAQPPLDQAVTSWFASFPYDKKVAVCADGTRQCHIQLTPDKVMARGEGEVNYTDYDWIDGTVYVVNGEAIIHESVYPASPDARVTFYAERLQFWGNVMIEGGDTYQSSLSRRVTMLSRYFRAFPRPAFVVSQEMKVNTKALMALNKIGALGSEDIVTGTVPLVLKPNLRQPEAVPGASIQAHLVSGGGFQCMAQALYETAPIEIAGTFAISQRVQGCYGLIVEDNACKVAGSKVVVRAFLNPSATAASGSGGGQSGGESAATAEPPPGPASNNMMFKLISFRED